MKKENWEKKYQRLLELLTDLAQKLNLIGIEVKQKEDGQLTIRNCYASSFIDDISINLTTTATTMKDTSHLAKFY